MGLTLTTPSLQAASAPTNFNLTANQLSPAPQVGTASVTKPASINLPQINHTFSDPQVAASANQYPIADTFTLTLSSTYTGTTGSTVIYLFNAGSNGFNNAVTQATGGAASSITYAWSDGSTTATPYAIQPALNFGRAGMGLISYGFTLVASNYTTAAGLSTIGGIANPSYIWHNFYNQTVPLSLNLAQQFSRSDYNLSTYICEYVSNLNALCQLAITIPSNTQYQITWYLTPYFKR